MNVAKGGYAGYAGPAAEGARAAAGFRSVMLAGAGAAEPAWFSFPESMLRALLGEEPQRHPAGPPAPPAARPVPVVLLVPVRAARPAGPAPRPAALQVVAGTASAASAVHRRAVMPAPSDPLAVAALPAASMQALPTLPARRWADGFPCLDPGVGETDPGVGDPWGRHRQWPRTPSMSTSSADSDDSLYLSLPSFGERTAAAKEMLSAAPGGPVRGNSFPKTTYAENQNMHSKIHQVTTFYDGPWMKRRKSKKGFCSFCKKNGETISTVYSHSLFKTVNGVDQVVCPQLRQIICPICKATGDNAHTVSYCPKGKEKVSVAVSLRTTIRRSDGSVRRRTSRI